MAAAAEEINFSLKVTINKEKTKVLFADVDSDFADVLLSFLTLPLGTIVRLLQKHYGDQAPAFGSVSNLYNSLANLDNAHFWTEACKLMLLNPRNSSEAECRKLKLNIDDTQPTKYFWCKKTDCLDEGKGTSMYYGVGRCDLCGKKLNREIDIRDLKSEKKDNCTGDGVFTTGSLSFLISDDLKMVPNVARSFIGTLSKLGITDVYGAEQRIVTIGFNEIMDLLKESLLSSTPLTDLLLHKRQMDTPAIKVKPVHHIKKEKTSDSEKMILKVMVQKSTNRFLFAQAEEDFVDFLFSFLTFHLAGVEWLLSGNTHLTNIDNLYNSSSDLIKYLKTQDTENSVFKRDLPPMYLSKNQIFSLSERIIPELYYHYCYHQNQCQYYLTSLKPTSDRKPVNFSNPKGVQGSYVKGPRMYTVTDDLTVTPLCMSSSVSILNEMKIRLSDVKELEIHIGLQEALNILKVSLTSTRALSSGLCSVLMKQP